MVSTLNITLTVVYIHVFAMTKNIQCRYFQQNNAEWHSANFSFSLTDSFLQINCIVADDFPIRT